MALACFAHLELHPVHLLLSTGRRPRQTERRTGQLHIIS